MTNVQTNYSMECRRAYERDGFQDGNNDLRRTAGRMQHYPDDLTLTTVAPANGTAAATVIATRAAKVFEISIDAAGSGGFLTLYNLTAATVGVSTLSMVLPFPASQTTVYRLYPGSLTVPLFSVGLTCGTVTVAVTSTAIGTAVNKVMFLTSTAP